MSGVGSGFGGACAAGPGPAAQTLDKRRCLSRLCLGTGPEFFGDSRDHTVDELAGLLCGVLADQLHDL